MALEQVVLRFEDYLSIEAMDVSRPVAGRHVLSDRREVRRKNTVVDVVAVSESFSVDRFRAFDQSLTDYSLSTWKKREVEWKKRAGVDFACCSAWASLYGFTEVRNAIQHGLGRITEMQFKRRDDVLAGIKVSGCYLDGDRVRVTDNDVRRCVDDCCVFISWLDARAPK